VCNIHWRVEVINSIPIAVFTDYSRCTLNQWEGSAEENVGDECYRDPSAGNSHLVTSNRGRYRHLYLGTQFQSRARSNEGVDSPWTDRRSSGSFPVIIVLFFQPPIWYIPEVLQMWENTW